ncbi:MAG: DPP IV N-terminal domain-containing protein [Bacteroidales bacterium]|nr:DPP IV N-terminal domain-containing protein [Bacteroidales bacterium]
MKFIFAIFCSACIQVLNCQYFSIVDIEIGRNTSLKPENLNGLQWRGSANNLIYLNDNYVMEIYSDSLFQDTIFSLEDCNNILKKNKLDTLKALPYLLFISDSVLAFCKLNQFYFINPYLKKLKYTYFLPETAENISFDKKGKHKVVYTVDNNVWFQDKNGNKLQITHDSAQGVTNGQIVYRNEFGIQDAYFWSPNSNYFAFYRNDESEVTNYPLVDISGRIAELNEVKYPMAGMNSQKTEVWVYALTDSALIKLNINSVPDDYHTNISWSPDEDLIYIQHLNRGQDTMELKSYSVKTGEEIELLFTETRNTYVEPQYPINFIGNTNDFLYLSSRDGYNHVYRYQKDKKKLKQLTKGDWEVTELIGLDSTDENFFFISTKESPLEKHLYKFNFQSGEVIRLTTEAGIHKITFNRQMTGFIDEFASMDVPRKVTINEINGNIIKELVNAENPVKDFTLGDVETGTILSADDNTVLYYKFVKPVDFDPEKKYPVLFYVYGGPHLQLIQNSWMDRIDYLQQYMAQHGYASFQIDPRGSSGRGKKFEEVIHRQTGIPQVEDYMEAVNFLYKIPFIDTSRIGVHGWSYGGYMTIMLMTRHPEIFKVGVAGGPVIDWKYYEVMYGERYMDTPEENPDGYDLTNLNNYVSDLKGDLLIIQGALDWVVVPQNCLTYIENCIKENKQVDFFMYPSHEHNVIGKDRLHLTKMITDYFIDKL